MRWAFVVGAPSFPPRRWSATPERSSTPWRPFTRGLGPTPPPPAPPPTRAKTTTRRTVAKMATEDKRTFLPPRQLSPSHEQGLWADKCKYNKVKPFITTKQTGYFHSYFNSFRRKAKGRGSKRERSHTGLICDQCSLTILSSNVNRHIKVCHNVNHKFKCR